MFTSIDLWAVLVATVIAYLAGWAWYSPFLWQKSWMKARGDNGTDWEQHGKKEMPKIVIYGLLNTFAEALTIAVFLAVTGVTTLTGSLQVALLLCFGFVVTIKFNDLLYTATPPHWGKRAQMLFLIDSGYQIVVFCVVASILWWMTL